MGSVTVLPNQKKLFLTIIAEKTAPKNEAVFLMFSEYIIQ